MDEELLAFLFAAAVRFSGLPALEARPPIKAMPYQAMLREICADLKADLPYLTAQHNRCLEEHKMKPSDCDDSKPEQQVRQYAQCIRQRGLVAAYLIEQERIVYRDDLDLNNDSDNSFIVHEFVHALQHHHLGHQLFETCKGVFSSEKQAYEVQQKYLTERGQFLRVGDRLRYVTCADIK